MSEQLFETFARMLPVDRHRLDDELEIQAEVQQRIAMEVVRLNTVMQEAKDHIRAIESRVASELKRETSSRVTDKQLDLEVSQDDRRITAFRDFNRAREAHEKWSALLDSWRQRGYAIKTLADLYSVQYFSLDTTYRNDRNEDRRRLMREAGERIDARRRADGDPVVSRRPNRERRVME